MEDKQSQLDLNSLQRFQFIEACLVWRQGLNASDIQKHFNVSKPTAKKYLDEYKALIKGLPLNYVASKKQYQAPKDYTPRYISLSLTDYQKCFGEQVETASDIEVLNAAERNINFKLVRTLLTACRENLRVEVGYRSMGSPDTPNRIIQPHSLIYDGLRYHLRAYCEKNQAFRDFVLSRFVDTAEIEGPATHTKQQDQEWQTQVDLVLIPDNRLTPEKQQIIELDYGMTNGRLTLTTRAALVKYLVYKYTVNTHHTNANAQQIMIEPSCKQAIEPYLPR